MTKLLFAIISLALLSHSARSQDKGLYDFHPPLKIPLILSSNFGELRPNHFHMGLDFKTNNKIGYNLYSIDDGFVSRVKVSAYGYGKVVYIDHPNGMTSVYAHCSEFKGAIDSLVRATQEREQNYEVEVFPGRNTIKVKKGEIIALSGNTGGSSGPHLHFEIRDTKTEHALNPLLYGFPIEDHKQPEMRHLKIYGLTQSGYRIPGKSVEKALVKSGSKYVVTGNTVTVNPSLLTKDGGLGFAFDVIDRFDGASNQCGLFGSRLIVDGDTIFGQETVRVPFESTRYVNSHKDYEEYQVNRRKYHKCFRTEENDLPIYINNALGLVKSAPGKSHQVKYIAFDAAGNESVVEFTLKVNDGAISSTNWGTPGKSNVVPQESFFFDVSDCKIQGGYATVYEPMEIDSDHLDTHFGSPETPVNRSYKIKVKVDGPKDGKHYLEMITAKGRTRAISVTYQDGWAVANCKYFGAYSLKRDETPPSAKMITYGNVIPASASKINWAISDDVSGIEDYDLFIDGKWYLLEYDYKSGYVTFQKPQGFKGKKEVRLVVKDACGNEKVLENSIDFQ
ncbi:MAG: M23 family metallopeptidase [bacterium]|nr:M23 family metallopeptidase [bacterium]